MKNIAFYPADILLPKDADLEKWAVVACDQFTSQPEYWAETEKIAGDYPSALRLILPEVKLGSPEVEKYIADINMNMEDYLDGDVFKQYSDSLIYIERVQSDGRVRHGIIGKIDLDDYEFAPGNKALIRATEGTVLTRIPPRVKVRENAKIELPHVMLLIDDPKKTVIEKLSEQKDVMEKIYDFELMQGGGHITGYLLGKEQIQEVAAGLEALTDSSEIQEKYGMGDVSPMLFAVGDGNHSLATAKQCYENLKKVTPKEEWDKLPAKYALVEVVNNHDDALSFEPIHRTIFDVDAAALLKAFKEYYADCFIIENADAKEVLADLAKYIPSEKQGMISDDSQFITYCYKEGCGTVVVTKPDKQLAVGTLQAFLDDYLKDGKSEIDYIHGDDVVMELGKKDGNLSFLLPAMGKEQLFKTVMADGVLPRKTFSMGHAQDKRYYIEARKIR